ncbi:FKBP-type peptidyl-prolyl cis-trans isomerase [Roseivirga echinicomitans]
MKSFLYTLSICLLLSLQTTNAFAQRTVEKYENGQKKYQGRMLDGEKVGKHTFWYEDGSKKREEKYNQRGILIELKEWDEEGNTVTDENPEEKLEKIREDQFKAITWIEVKNNLGISKVKGEVFTEPILEPDDVILHYATYLLNGREIDSSFRTKKPIGINLKSSGMIDGFQEGLKYFQEGDNGFIRIPARMAYGSEGTREVPPNATLIFQVYILKR